MMLSIVALAVSSSLAMSVPSASVGVVDVATDGKTKINLAGRQRMLSQRMAKAACLSSIGTHGEEFLGELQHAYDDFEKALAGLQHGDETLGMLKETDERILGSLSDVEVFWEPYKASISAILTASGGEKDFSQLPEQAMTVLRGAHRAVGVIESVYATGGDVSPVRARTINVAGRQRMLSQKAAKEYCFIMAGIEPEKHRAALEETIGQFDQALINLRGGTDGLETPTGAAERQLETVQGVWDRLRPRMEAALHGVELDKQELGIVAAQSNRLLSDMNRVVYIYSVLQ